MKLEDLESMLDDLHAHIHYYQQGGSHLLNQQEEIAKMNRQLETIELLIDFVRTYGE